MSYAQAASTPPLVKPSLPVKVKSFAAPPLAMPRGAVPPGRANGWTLSRGPFQGNPSGPFQGNTTAGPTTGPLSGFSNPAPSNQGWESRSDSYRGRGAERGSRGGRGSANYGSSSRDNGERRDFRGGSRDGEDENRWGASRGGRGSSFFVEKRSARTGRHTAAPPPPPPATRAEPPKISLRPDQIARLATFLRMSAAACAEARRGAGKEQDWKLSSNDAYQHWKLAYERLMQEGSVQNNPAGLAWIEANQKAALHLSTTDPCCLFYSLWTDPKSLRSAHSLTDLWVEWLRACVFLPAKDGTDDSRSAQRPYRTPENIPNLEAEIENARRLASAADWSLVDAAPLLNESPPSTPPPKKKSPSKTIVSSTLWSTLMEEEEDGEDDV